MGQVVHVDVEELGPHLSPQLIGQKASVADGCSPQGLNVHRIAGHRIGTHTVKWANSCVVLETRSIFLVWVNWLNVLTRQTNRSFTLIVDNQAILPEYGFLALLA